MYMRELQPEQYTERYDVNRVYPSEAIEGIDEKAEQQRRLWRNSNAPAWQSKVNECDNVTTECGPFGTARTLTERKLNDNEYVTYRSARSSARALIEGKINSDQLLEGEIEMERKLEKLPSRSSMTDQDYINNHVIPKLLNGDDGIAQDKTVPV